MIALKFFPLLVSLALISCVQTRYTTPPEEPEPAETAEVRTEKTDKIVVEELSSGTGAIAERLLSTGIIEVGSREAPVTLMVFTEHHAKYAQEFQIDQFPRLFKEFIETGKLKFQVAILPLKKYPQSESAASGLLCAAMQSKGMAMHQSLSENLETERLEPKHYAEELGINMEEFSRCMEAEETSFILKQQNAWAQSLDVTLVPTFFLNGEKHVGLPYYPDLRGTIIEKLR